jgi:hypothetical protein
MAEILRLFVSATNDLEAERALIGRAVAGLPAQIRMEIRRTPAAGAKYDDIYELIANVDRFYFLMGQDITAPAGAEWHLAWQLERSVLPLQNTAPRSPAAQEFLRAAPIPWQVFHSATELVQLITLDLVRILNHPTNRYGLTVNELELLALHGERVKRSRVQQMPEPGGAEGGGILLDDGRREPTEGVALDE